MLTPQDEERYYAVIMAGGGGTRLWPWSHAGQPKQMLNICGDRSMFQMTVDRLEGIITKENTMVVTTAEQAVALQEQVPEVDPENYIPEPLPRGTASVVGIAAITLLAKNKDAVMAVLTADHYIRNEAFFRKLLDCAFHCAEEGHLVTLGIEPTFPSTGMGYIEQGEPIRSDIDLDAYKVARFTEKPDLETAKAFLATGKYAWNSGMFVWRADKILEEIRRYIPDLYDKLMVIAGAIGTDRYLETLSAVWPTIQPTTIDYGVMEKAEDVIVLPARGLGWNDIGSWESIYEVRDGDEQGNIFICSHAIPLDSEGVVFCSENPEKLLVSIGMKDVVIVETEKAVLVCPKQQSQRVKEIVQKIKETDQKQYL